MSEKVVTPPEKRARRYESKIDADVVRARITALKDTMVESASARQAEIARIQADVKSILESEGVLPEFYIPFMKIGTKLYGLSRRHSGEVFSKEAKYYLDATYLKYKEVFATAFPLGDILSAIANLFGITWSPPSS